MRRRLLRYSAVIFFAGWACARGSGTGCSSCADQGFSYPSNVPGKEPIANAGELRINQTALDWVEAHLSDFFLSQCCPADPASSLSPADQCWGKAACFTDVEGGVPMLHFYLGSPNQPLALPDGFHLRTGDDYPDESVGPDSPPADDTVTGNSAARPYCNDVGGVVCQRENQDLASFCRPSSSDGCNAANPDDPSQRDYCCGDGVHGADSSTPLDICTGKRALPRCHGYPSNLVLRLDQLQNIHLQVLAASDTTGPGISLAVNGVDIGIDIDLEVDVASQSLTCFAKDADPSVGSLQNASISIELRPTFARPSPDQPEVLVIGADQITVSNFSLPTLNVPSVTADSLDPKCQKENWSGGTTFSPSDSICQGGCTALASTIGSLFSDPGTLQGLLSGPLTTGLASALAGRLNGLPVEIAAELNPRALISQTLPLQFGNEIGVLAGADDQRLWTEGSDSAIALSAGIDIGTESESHACVPTLPPPPAVLTGDAALPATITVMDNSQTPSVARSENYHVAAAISQTALVRAFYNVFNSGLLCVGFDSEEIAKLTSGAQVLTAGTLFVLAPELKQIADGDSAPLFVQVEPRGYPSVNFGTGQPTGQLDRDGQPIIDSLVQLQMEHVALSMYAFSQDRFVRVFTESADLSLGLSILRGPNNALSLAIDSIGTDNLSDDYNALSATDYTAVAKLLLNLAVNGLLSSSLELSLNFDSALQQVLGPDVYLRINDIQRAGTANDYVAVYLTACKNGDASNGAACTDGGTPASDIVAPTLSDALPLYVAPQAPLPADLRTSLVPAGRVAIHVQDDGFAREYSVRVDGGAAHSLTLANAHGDIVVASPALTVFGNHRLEIRSQAAGHYETLGAPKVLDLELDAERPLAVIEPQTEAARIVALRVSATDLVSAPDAITLQWRGTTSTGVSAWHPTAQGAVLDAALLREVDNLQLRAVDHAGNVSDIVTYAWQTSANKRGHGCHNSGDVSLIVFALLGIVLRRRATR